MKTSFLTILLVLSSLLLKAQNHTSVEKAIRELEDKVVKGILTSDSLLLKQVWTPEFMVNTPRNNIAPNRAAVLSTQTSGLINYSSFERVIEQLLIQENLVITRGRETYVPRTDLPEAKTGQTVRRRFTNVWAKQNSTWLQMPDLLQLFVPDHLSEQGR